MMEGRSKFVFTPSNWGKNIFDSTAPLRNLLSELQICDYDEMQNGKENGIVVPIKIRIGETEQIGQMSIYRSKTRGDKRFGISNIKDLGDLDDEMAIFFDEDEKDLVCLIIKKTMSIENTEKLQEETKIQIDEYPIPDFEDDETNRKKHELDHSQETIGSLLDGTQIFVMPMFQRKFKWEKPQFDTLWGDIDDIWYGNESSQFLGAILVSISKPGVGSITQENWVIDGQQRLTTLFSLICAITKVAQDNGFKSLAENFADPLIVMKGTKKNTPTIIPTISDTKQFNDILKTLKETTGKQILPSDRGKNVRLINAWKQDLMKGVKKRVVDSKGNIDPKKLEYLFEIVKDRLFFMMIVLPTELNPYMIFERLNNTGKKLSAGDLVRNLIFENLIDMPEAAEELYEGHMLEYEQSFVFRVNNNTKSKLDDYYFPFTLTRPIENVTKAKMYVQLRHYWKKKKATSAAMIEELKEMAPVYIALCPEFPEEEILFTKNDETDPIRDSDKIWERLLRLRRFKPPTTTFPYLMELLQYYRKNRNDEDEVVKCLDIFESYLIRRNICSLQNAGFTNFFRGMWKACGHKPDPVSLLRKLKSTSGYEYPDDESVIRELKIANMYSKRQLTRYILNEYEISDKNSGHNNYVMENYSMSSIEHIVPEDFTKWVPRMKNWKFSEDVKIIEGTEPDYQKWFSKYGNALGNLTILQPYENSEASNYDWDLSFEMSEDPKKCKQYYYSNRAKYRRIKDTAQKYLSEYSNISHDERSEILTEWIVNRWQYYG